MRLPISAPTVAAAAKDGKVVEKRGGNGTQTFRALSSGESAQQAQSLSHRLPPVALDGKEGVRGSSPREGFRKFLLISFFRRLMRRQKRGAASTERPRAAAVFSYESAKSCC